VRGGGTGGELVRMAYLSGAVREIQGVGLCAILLTLHCANQVHGSGGASVRGGGTGDACVKMAL
jgi:hypothetical protein